MRRSGNASGLSCAADLKTCGPARPFTCDRPSAQKEREVFVAANVTVVVASLQAGLLAGARRDSLRAALVEILASALHVTLPAVALFAADPVGSGTRAASASSEQAPVADWSDAYDAPWPTLDVPSPRDASLSGGGSSGDLASARALFLTLRVSLGRLSLASGVISDLSALAAASAALAAAAAPLGRTNVLSIALAGSPVVTTTPPAPPVTAWADVAAIAASRLQQQVVVQVNLTVGAPLNLASESVLEIVGDCPGNPGRRCFVDALGLTNHIRMGSFSNVTLANLHFMNGNCDGAAGCRTSAQGGGGARHGRPPAHAPLWHPLCVHRC